ncbi:MAG: hypothetical protein WC333_00055 [Dehalococcoidia bacterium]|jgi:hypothetical protein
MKSNLGRSLLVGIIALVLIFGGVLGIRHMSVRHAPMKPFTVTSKLPYPDGNCKFEYYDANSRHFEFTDRCDKYFIGDVIK